MALIDDVAVVLVGTVGLNGESADAVRMTSIEAEQTSINATLAGLTTADITNIDETGAATGLALLRNAANDGYELGSAAGTLATVQGWDWDGGTATVDITDVDNLRASRGLTAVTSADPNTAYITPSYGGTGSKDLVARSDHTHTTPTTTPATYTSKGTLSSGSVTLVSTNVTLPAAGAGEAAKVYRVRVELFDTERGNGGSSYFTQSITINGNTRTSGTRQTVGGVPASPGFVHSQTITGDGTAKTITAALAFVSGDPLTVDAGEIVIDVDCNR